MPFINYPAREIGFKIVYYGPGLSGKTTNLLYIYNHLARENRGELFSLNTADERTLFFDFFPVELGKIEGYGVRFNLYTVPGQTYYEASRRLILDGADGLVFVADSQSDRLEENIQAFKLMLANLDGYGMSLSELPLVLQYNKRDCRPLISLGTLESELGLNRTTAVEAVATNGLGVRETISHVCRDIIMRFTF